MQYAREIQLAGLLHDIGKLYQKGISEKIDYFSTVGKPHGEISGDFIRRYSRMFGKYGLDTDALMEFTRRHHTNDYGNKEKNAMQMVQNAPERYKKYCEIISIADNLSSSEREKAADEEKRGFTNQTKPLSSIFTRVGNDTKHRYNHTPVEYSIPFTSKMMPSEAHEKNNPHAVYALINSFTSAINTLELNAPDTFEELMDNLNFILVKYCWCIPSAYQNEVADISLYDHLKTTSAIALALYYQVYAEYGEDFKKSNISKMVGKIALLKVDMVGVNKWLGVSSSIDAIKEVTHRQATVKKMYDGIDKELVDCGLCVTSNVIDTGATKYFIVPKALEDTLLERLGKISTALAINTGLVVSLTVQTVEFGDASRFERMPEVLGEFSGSVNNTKLSVVSLLSGKDGWVENIGTDGTMASAGFGVSTIKLVAEFIEDHPDMESLDILRIDLDNMRKIFETGLISDFKHYGSVSRLSTMSRMVEGYMQRSIPKEYSECLFITNTSDDIVCLVDSRESVGTALAIRDQIDQFSLGQLKVSCVIARYSNKYSIKSLLQSIEMELSKIKRGGGDKLSHMGTVIDWANVDDYTRLVDELVNIASKPGLSGILYRLMEYSTMYQKFIETGDPIHLMCVSKVSVDRVRSYGTADRPKVPVGLQVRIKNAFKGSMVNRDVVDPFAYNLGQAVADAMLFSRTKRYDN